MTGGLLGFEKPMLATAGTTIPMGDHLVLEPKFDGWRVMVYCSGRGVKVYGGRNAADYTGKLLAIEQQLKATLPPDTLLDGELVGEDWGQVQSVMTRARLQPGDAPGRLVYMAFDVLRLRGEDVTGRSYSERRKLLEGLSLPTANVAITPTFPATPRTHQVLVAEGFEGSVVKDTTAAYYPDTRSPSWIKVKAEFSVEAVVTGWEESKTQNSRVGALAVHLVNDDGSRGAETTVSGMDHATREWIKSRFQQDWLGQIIEITHNGVMKSGKPRHPRYKRRRDDRTAQMVKPKTLKQHAASKPSTGSPKSWVRNYAAMSDAKLMQCVRELEAGSGAAVQRVGSKGGDVKVNLLRAQAVAVDRGLMSI